jgi:hypothetical protein
LGPFGLFEQPKNVAVIGVRWKSTTCHTKPIRLKVPLKEYTCASYLAPVNPATPQSAGVVVRALPKGGVNSFISKRTA